MSPDIAKFSPSLFWDVDRETVDVRNNKRWLIARVLGYGRLRDWKALRMLYPLAGIRLVGGTSQALQLGHRKSVALDLFGRLGR